MNQRMPPPDDNEDYSDFMDRCTDELDEDECQLIWDEERSGADSIIRKTHLQEKVEGLEFVMLDETKDLMGDIIMQDGWGLDNFKFDKNPIALFGHKSDFIIGGWKNVRVENRQLRGTLQLAEKGTSPRVDEIISLVKQGFLRAVSVGFRPEEYEPLDKENPFSGYKFTKQKLVECSLVSCSGQPQCVGCGQVTQDFTRNAASHFRRARQKK